MLSTALEQAIDRAMRNAQSARHEFLMLEHLLLSLLDEPSVSDAILALGGDLMILQENLNRYLDEHSPKFDKEDNERSTQPTVAFQRMIQRAVLHVRNSGKTEVTCLTALVAILTERDSYASFFLKKQGIERLELTSYISHGKTSEHSATSEETSEDSAENSEKSKPAPKSAIKEFTVNLNEKARDGQIDPVIGREKEIERAMQTLCRRRKNNPLLVGEAGVGKTAIAEGLAKAIVEGEVPEILANAKIFSLDIGSLLAGTKYRGDFENRLKSFIKRTQKKLTMPFYLLMKFIQLSAQAQLQEALWTPLISSNPRFQAVN
nr:Clp protease N-terminal domain-containing protein [Rappaport israeli]